MDFGLHTSDPAAPSKEGLDWTDYVPHCALLETRRSVRTGLFVACFWGCNLLAMTSLLVPYILERTDVPHGIKYSLSGLNELQIFWIAVILAFLVALPARAIFATSPDIRSGAMELLLMTGTNPLSILTGKWIAKMMEAVIMVSSLMPYTVLHYFEYGINPLYQIFLLCGVLLGSAGLCALATGLSVIRSPLKLVILVPLGMLFVAFIGANILFAISSLVTVGNWLGSGIMLGVFITALIALPLCGGAALLMRPPYDRPDVPIAGGPPDLSFPVSRLKRRPDSYLWKENGA